MNDDSVVVAMTEEQRHMHRLVSDADKLYHANIVEICAVNRSVNEWVTNAEKRIANLESQLAAPKTRLSCDMAIVKAEIPATIQAHKSFEIGWKSALENLDPSSIMWPLVKPEDVQRDKYYAVLPCDDLHWEIVSGDVLIDFGERTDEIRGPIPLPKGGEE